jgi:hypothetical protein
MHDEGGEGMVMPVAVGGDMAMSLAAYFYGLQKTVCI